MTDNLKDLYLHLYDEQRKYEQTAKNAPWLAVAWNVPAAITASIAWDTGSGAFRHWQKGREKELYSWALENPDTQSYIMQQYKSAQADAMMFLPAVVATAYCIGKVVSWFRAPKKLKTKAERIAEMRRSLDSAVNESMPAAR